MVGSSSEIKTESRECSSPYEFYGPPTFLVSFTQLRVLSKFLVFLETDPVNHRQKKIYSGQVLLILSTGETGCTSLSV